MNSSTQQPSAAVHYSVSAQYYDEIYVDSAPQDLELYQELAAECGGRILELGCGTGRVSLPLARAGHSITALDLSPAMLERFRTKLALEPAEVQQRVELLAGDMVELELSRQFGLILSPFRAFQHVTEAADQRRCLTAVARHLADGGRFVFNAFEPNYSMIERNRQAGLVWQMDHEVPLADGGVIRRFYFVRPDTVRQIQHVWLRYEVYSPQQLLLSTEIEQFDMRWMNRYEAQYLLELSGLEVVAAYGGFDRRPMDEQQRELIYVCQRA
jgi:ubiquinone/menaquinone biosynthesis C-methylase UbiE